jgi:hypothetical protein
MGQGQRIEDCLEPEEGGERVEGRASPDYAEPVYFCSGSSQNRTTDGKDGSSQTARTGLVGVIDGNY